MVANSSKIGGKSISGSIIVTDWNVCHNSGDDVIALSCMVATSDSSAAISSVGLMLNNSAGLTLASSYTEFSSNSESATPSLNLPPSELKVGDTIVGVVSGQAEGQHYFFEQELVIGNC